MSYDIAEPTTLRGKARSTKRLRLGLFGFGVVGTGVWKILEAKREEFHSQFGVELTIAGICVREMEKPREIPVPSAIVTDRRETLLDDDSIDVVLELIGGRYEAQAVIESALRSRKHVITANKLVLAHELPRLRSIAERNGVNLYYSASVCGSVPVLRALDEIKQSDTIVGIRGIVNGSTNFILTMMGQVSTDGACAEYEAAMYEARRRGFLEADPTLDVSGADAAQKLSVLIYHAFGRHVLPQEIETNGIEHITSEDFVRARSGGQTFKLIASAELDASGSLRASVKPELISTTHLFAHTRDEFNALEIQCHNAGPQVLYGKGAGSLPTASAVVSDLIELLKEE
ncbi:MAG: homoserine dehydrogenase [Bacteroidota bacterium]|nr:homoserine dehydrogenase [Bacteroidota bacterium]MDP4233091.1 homoserine dehydrogenase [Bacteroidota bacterium]MDP4241764.1 homoserine dehydrogenase [Bacteroidota bacterium]MDP4287422.1 homoserine dehydrogenase [Bacteroidota bacterium]